MYKRFLDCSSSSSPFQIMFPERSASIESPKIHLNSTLYRFHRSKKKRDWIEQHCSRSHKIEASGTTLSGVWTTVAVKLTICHGENKVQEKCTFFTIQRNNQSFVGSFEVIFFSKLTCTIGSQSSPDKMVAGNFLWLHLLKDRGSIHNLVPRAFLRRGEDGREKIFLGVDFAGTSFIS